ncbi:MAG: DivIVA domain-containing protein [Candidatus Marinimicrobia bacterium]|nr:DivIVA domain-containing protein [Candidatus Neomarinimicrobiota bacterium]
MIEKEDIIDRKFDKELLGYDKVEVQYFQKMIAKEFDKLNARIEELEKIQSEYEKIKGQKAADIVEEGKQKAADIISNAQQKADSILSDMREKKERIENSVNELELKKASLINSINKILENQNELLELYYQENEK